MRTIVTVGDVARMVETWAPPAIAWERDNVGLQLGSNETVVRGILVCLDVDGATIREASRRGANLVISHHPLLFNPPRRLVSGNDVTDTVRLAITNGIDVYSAHTNFDFSRGGVSFILAEKLGLTDIDFLHRSSRTKRKVVTYVPPAQVEAVARSMADSGAGQIGNYDQCSFRIEGTGTFRGNSESSPRTGERGRFQRVEEIRLEMIVDEWQVPDVLAAMKGSHPYEAIAYDVIPVENLSPEYGMGAIASLPRPLRIGPFIRRVKQLLGAGTVRYTDGTGGLIKRVAVCGGSGSELLTQAIKENADAFVTADVKYHTFQNAEGRIALIDAGHHETEFPAVRVLAQKIRTALKGRASHIPVTVTRGSTNPVMFA